MIGCSGGGREAPPDSCRYHIGPRLTLYAEAPVDHEDPDRDQERRVRVTPPTWSAKSGDFSWDPVWSLDGTELVVAHAPGLVTSGQRHDGPSKCWQR